MRAPKRSGNEAKNWRYRVLDFFGSEVSVSDGAARSVESLDAVIDATRRTKCLPPISRPSTLAVYTCIYHPHYENGELSAKYFSNSLESREIPAHLVLK